MSKQKSILAIFAHPDDESFTVAGTLAQNAAQGVEVSLICATRGEAGEIADPSLATPENLGQVREQELRCAAEILGLKEVIFLDYRDSGMAGSDGNNHPQAFVNAPAFQIVPLLVQEIRRLQPQVVITFEPGGGYGHPDHLTIHQTTVAALQAAAAVNFRPELGAPWQVQRLLYSSLPRSFFEGLSQRMEQNGLDNSQIEEMINGDHRTFWPDEAVDFVVEVNGFIKQKMSAIRCHQTQLKPDNQFMSLPEAELQAQWGTEYFSLAWPKPGDKKPTGLFSGL